MCIIVALGRAGLSWAGAAAVDTGGKASRAILAVSFGLTGGWAGARWNAAGAAHTIGLSIAATGAIAVCGARLGAIARVVLATNALDTGGLTIGATATFCVCGAG